MLKLAKSRWIAVLSVLGVLVLLLAACAPAATPTPPPVVATPTPGIATPTPTPGVATPTPPPGAATPAPFVMPGPSATPQSGGIFRASTTWEPAHWDSHRTVSASVAVFSQKVFSPLIRYSPYMDASDTGYDYKYLESALAERWEVSSDSKVYTFYLRKGVKFHDGKPFTAKDVKYTIEKLQDPKRSVWTANFASVDRLEVVDDYTVKFYLKQPTRLFLHTLGGYSGGYGHIQPEHLKDVVYRTLPFAVGTGPFKLKSYTPGVATVFERNPDYFIKGRPYIDGIDYKHLAAAAARNAFIAGQLDSSGVGSTDDKEAFKKFAPEVLMELNPRYPIMRGLMFNFVREGPWGDARVRKAMAMVMDYKGGVLAAYGGLDEGGDPRVGYLISAPLGEGLPWSEYEKVWWLGRPEVERVAEAKRLLSEAGYPRGFQASISWSSGDRIYEGPGLIFIDMVRKIGIDLKAAPVERARWVTTRTEADFDLSFEAWGPASYGEEMLTNAYYSKAGTNYMRYSHPTIDEIAVQIGVEPDPQKAREMLHRAERILMADIPLIPVYKANGISARWPYIKDVHEHPFNHTNYGGQFEVLWFDRNDPTWKKRG